MRALHALGDGDTVFVSDTDNEIVAAAAPNIDSLCMGVCGFALVYFQGPRSSQRPHSAPWVSESKTAAAAMATPPAHSYYVRFGAARDAAAFTRLLAAVERFVALRCAAAPAATPATAAAGSDGQGSAGEQGAEQKPSANCPAEPQATLQLGVNFGRRAAFAALLGAGYRVTATGLSMELENGHHIYQGYNKSNRYVVDDWR